MRSNLDPIEPASDLHRWHTRWPGRAASNTGDAGVAGQHSDDPYPKPAGALPVDKMRIRTAGPKALTKSWKGGFEPPPIDSESTALPTELYPRGVFNDLSARYTWLQRKRYQRVSETQPQSPERPLRTWYAYRESNPCRRNHFSISSLTLVGHTGFEPVPINLKG